MSQPQLNPDAYAIEKHRLGTTNLILPGEKTASTTAVDANRSL